MFNVIKKFRDLQDNDHVYEINDVYPHNPKNKLTAERINELMSNENKIGAPLIEEKPLNEVDSRYLYALAKLKEIKVPKKTSAEDIRKLIEDSNDE